MEYILTLFNILTPTADMIEVKFNSLQSCEKFAIVVGMDRHKDGYNVVWKCEQKIIENIFQKTHFSA